MENIIYNELITRGYSVDVGMVEIKKQDKDGKWVRIQLEVDFIASLGMYDLLVIDDLGVERNTEYAMEQMFTVIDGRYRSRKPMIITTNLKLEEIKNPPDLAHARIYDRILEWCAPVLFSGRNFREEQE